MPLGPRDARAAGAVLARAFHDDPVWAWTLPDDERRRRALPWVFERIVALESRRVHVVAAGGGAGVALWVPPDARTTTRRDLWRAGFPLMSVRLGREAYGRIAAFQSASRELLARIVVGPSWFLSGLGVDPPAQRQGLGTQLVAWGVERSQSAGRSAVLLTSNEANVAFYERRGFSVVAEERLPASGPRTWALRTGAA